MRVGEAGHPRTVCGIRTCGALVVLLFTLSSMVSAQEDDRWQITLDARECVWDVRLRRLEGDSLVVRQADSSLRVPVERITEIRLIRKRLTQIFLHHPSGP
ncbi:MAG: hypothetical protein H0X69_05025 [Gemmatimonadales bacterium]|nr:hypothetical protein [Gemmatimonadales bacterium]